VAQRPAQVHLLTTRAVAPAGAGTGRAVHLTAIAPTGVGTHRVAARLTPGEGPSHLRHPTSGTGTRTPAPGTGDLSATVASSQGQPIANLSGMGVIQALQYGANWVIYEPVTATPGAYVSPDQITRELTVLYNRGFRGLVTYSFYNGREEIPRIAKQVGFQQVIAGIEAQDHYQTEKSNLTPDRLRYIDGFVVGNEGLYFHKYDLATLKSRMAEIKALSGGKPTTTSEPWNIYDGTGDKNAVPGLTALGDWIFPNLHPFYEQGWPPAHEEPAKGVQFDADVYKKFFASKASPSRPAVLHESWWPSAVDSWRGNPVPPSYRKTGTLANQAAYFRILATTPVPFIYGEAFDEPWKSGEGDAGTGDPGTHWGLWHDTRSPKNVVGVIQTGPRPRLARANLVNRAIPSRFWQRTADGYTASLRG
jgi:exo-beta-1,3-glucanase (GH17 family)